MSRIFLLALCLLTLSNCGIKRPLMAPSEIPAYEESQRKKRERLMQEQQTNITAPAPSLEVTK